MLAKYLKEYISCQRNSIGVIVAHRVDLMDLEYLEIRPENGWSINITNDDDDYDDHYEFTLKSISNYYFNLNKLSRFNF